MRIRLTERQLRPLQRLQAFLIKTMSGGTIAPPILITSYRRELFGKYYVACVQAALRETTEWEISEVEIMAAFISQQNQCQYCVGAHSKVAELATSDANLIEAVLADWQTAPISEKLRVSLAFLQQLTLQPQTITAKNLEPLLAAGVSEKAIEEAVYVCFCFSIMNRLADAFDFDLPTPEGRLAAAKILLSGGYLSSSLRG